ncbi:MAG: ABC transporter substrate-binding protein [Treponema sp.]|nr:ABC transporter substrate-binding protein [Treponema sp.]
MKKGIFALAAAVMVVMLALTGCPGGVPREPGVLVVGNIGDPPSLDPANTNDSASSAIYQQIFDRLFDQSHVDLSISPALAESWQFEDGPAGPYTRLRVFLRQGVLFHNGDEMRASDVAFSLNRAIASAHVSFMFGPVAGTEIVGEFEVLITLSEPWMPALSHFAHNAASIVSERAVREMGEAAFGQNPVGTGPMRFASWVVGDHLRLQRWDYYWGTPSTLNGIVIRTIPDAATRLLELETGGIDVMYAPQPQDLARLSANPQINVLRRPGMNTNYVGFNTTRPFINDIRVRQAIVYALDLGLIVENVFMGVGAPGRAPVTSQVWANAAGVLPLPARNIERARELLAEAGHPGGGFTLSFYFNEGNVQRMDTGVIMQAMLAEVGIGVEVRAMEWAAYLEMTANPAGGHDMFMLGWVTVTGDPDYGLDIFHSRNFGAAGNRFFWSDPEVDRLLDAARGQTNPQARYDMYIEAQRLIMAGLPLIMVQEGEVIVAARSNVSGLIVNPAGEENLWAVRLD